MTWADPSERVTGASITSAIWNTQVTNSRNITYNQIQYGIAAASENKAIGAGGVLAFDTDFSVYEGYSNHVNLDRLYAVVTGLHLFAATLVFSGATALTLRKNGSSLRSLGSYTYYNDTALIYLEAGDYIDMTCATARTLSAGSGIQLKLLTGGWTDYSYWGEV